MIGTFMITWRESIEAALLVGILMAYLKKIGQEKQFVYIYSGVGLGVVASICFGYLSYRASFLFEGVGEDVFGALILFLAVIVLTYMVIWMSDQAKHLKGNIQQKVDAAFAQRKLVAISLLTFAGVFREGVETVLFLWGIVLQNQGARSFYPALLSGMSGLILAIVMVWLVFRGIRFLDLKTFFKVTGLILLLMSAGMLVGAVGKLESAGWISPVFVQVWNSTRLIDEQTLVGHILSGFLGYRAKPSLTEILAYFLYFVAISLWLRKPFPRPGKTNVLVN